jgi:hypothetical protein
MKEWSCSKYSLKELNDRGVCRYWYFNDNRACRLQDVNDKVACRLIKVGDMWGCRQWLLVILTAVHNRD